jgi:hypothetical protein
MGQQCIESKFNNIIGTIWMIKKILSIVLYSNFSWVHREVIQNMSNALLWDTK